MRNGDSDQKYSESPRTRCCGHCGEALLTQRKHARYCDRRCKELARGARKRAGERLTTLRARHPFADRADLPEFSDEFDIIGLDDEDQDDDDDAGIIGGGHLGYDPDAAWRERMAYTDAEEAVKARYESQLRPYRDALRRNQGVKPVAMARLEAARDAEIRGLTYAHQKAEAMAWAAREAPHRAVQAAERQLEYAALNALGAQLPGGSRRYHVDEFHGRDTTDIATWGR